jgi:hypothetical protein
MTTATIKTQRVHDGFHSWVEVSLPGTHHTMSLGGITHPFEQLNYDAGIKLNPILKRWGGITVRTAITIEAVRRELAPIVTDEDLYEQEIVLLKGWCVNEDVRLKPLTAQALANRIYAIAKKYHKAEHEVINNLLKSL